jgi:hypothetical protein
VSDPAGFIDEPPPRRRSEAFAPIEVWRRALLVMLLGLAAAGAWASYVRTPMPVAVDTPLYAEQFAKLDRQASAARKAGGQPLSMVLIGTSRLRNAALDAEGMAQQAKAAGIERPLVSTVLGVNWGGFERFAPALAMIEQRKPDVIVIMPELLAEDFTPVARARVGKSWLESVLWGTEFSPFAVGETTRQVCIGFDQSPAEREAEATALIKPNLAGRGPGLARAFLRRMAARGTTVVVADVPVTQPLAALRPPLPQGQALLASLGIGDLPGAHAIVIGPRFAQSVYCDVAHFKPAQDHLWQAAFFARAAPLLGALR